MPKVRVQLDFVVDIAGSDKGLIRIYDFIEGGLEKVLTDADYPVEIMEKATIRLTNPEAHLKVVRKRRR